MCVANLMVLSLTVFAERGISLIFWTISCLFLSRRIGVLLFLWTTLSRRLRLWTASPPYDLLSCHKTRNCRPRWRWSTSWKHVYCAQLSFAVPKLRSFVHFQLVIFQQMLLSACYENVFQLSIFCCALTSRRISSLQVSQRRCQGKWLCPCRIKLSIFFWDVSFWEFIHG